MEHVLANLNRRVTNKEGASPLLVGTGKDNPSDALDRRVEFKLIEDEATPEE